MTDDWQSTLPQRDVRIDVWSNGWQYRIITATHLPTGITHKEGPITVSAAAAQARVLAVLEYKVAHSLMARLVRHAV